MQFPLCQKYKWILQWQKYLFRRFVEECLAIIQGLFSLAQKKPQQHMVWYSFEVPHHSTSKEYLQYLTSIEKLGNYPKYYDQMFLLRESPMWF